MYKILFSHDDIELCKKKIGKQNQLAFAIMFGYYRSYIKFPAPIEGIVSQKLILQISTELNIASIELASFKWEGRTAKRFRLNCVSSGY